jgi:hypothetical protein
MGLPTHFFVDAEGVLTSINVGPVTQSQALEHLGLN